MVSCASFPSCLGFPLGHILVCAILSTAAAPSNQRVPVWPWFRRWLLGAARGWLVSRLVPCHLRGSGSSSDYGLRQAARLGRLNCLSEAVRVLAVALIEVLVHELGHDEGPDDESRPCAVQ